MCYDHVTHTWQAIERHKTLISHGERRSFIEDLDDLESEVRRDLIAVRSENAADWRSREIESLRRSLAPRWLSVRAPARTAPLCYCDRLSPPSRRRSTIATVTRLLHDCYTTQVYDCEKKLLVLQRIYRTQPTLLSATGPHGERGMGDAMHLFHRGR